MEADGGVGAVKDLETQIDVDGLSTSAGSKEGKSVEGTEGTKQANVDSGLDKDFRTENEFAPLSVVGESKEINALHESAKNTGSEMVSITSSTFIEDSKDVSEGVMVLAGDEALDPMVVDEETNGSGGDVVQGSEAKEVDGLHNETPNPATETAFVTSSIIIKDSTPASKVLAGGAYMMAGDEGLNPRVEGPDAHALETPGGVASERIISSSHGDSTSTEKGGNSKKTSNSKGDQKRVTAEGKGASVDDEDTACPNIEGMDNDAFNEIFCFSVEELQATVETANGSTENHFDVFADPHPFYQATEVVVGVEAASKQDKERFNSTEPQKVTVEECLDQVAGNSAQVHSTVDPVMVVGKEVTCVLLGGIQKEQGPEQLEKIEAKSGNAENLGKEKKVEEVHSAGEAVHVSSGTDTLVTDGEENVVTTDARPLNSKAAFETRSDNNRQLEVRGSVDNSTASDLDSSIGQEMKFEEHVDLHDGEEMEVEQGTGAEKPRTTAHESVKWEALMHGSSEKTHQANYQLPPGSNGKGGDSFADDLSAPEERKTISFAKVSTPKPSFKIGDCISRVASQMTGSPSILKSNGQKPDGGSDGLTGDPTDTSFQQCVDAEMKRTVVPAESSPLEDLLSQFQCAAKDPLKGYNSFSIIISFFSDFRNSVVIDQQDKVGGKRRKASHYLGSSETFEFEDMNDTYWRDRFIENGSEEQPSRKSRKRDNHFVPVILGKPFGRSNSRKRYSDTIYDVAEQKPVGYVDEKVPAEIVMHFPVVESVPSEINLNKMFKSFGPLRESETEVDRDTNRARVVFKRCSDAEVAYSSAPRFSIFGSTLVNYQLNYVISVPFKAPAVAIDHEEDDPTLFLQY